MISIIITSFNEPETIGKAVESFLQQRIKEKYELIVAAPDISTLNVVRKYKKKNKQVKIFRDPGQGKSLALNLLLQKVKGKIIILTDGDVFVSENSVAALLQPFKNPEVGCAAGQPTSINSRKKMFGYWSHLLCHAAHELRLERAKKYKFLECSGYLWAFRSGVIKSFPKDLAEDTIVPILFWKKNWKIAYSPEAKVYVKFPDKLNDFLKQKRRTAAGHETLSRYVNLKKIPRMKTLANEILGSFIVLLYPKTLKEMFWTLSLFPIRLYVWMNLFYNMKIKKRYYKDSWKQVKTTK